MHPPIFLNSLICWQENVKIIFSRLLFMELEILRGLVFLLVFPSSYVKRCVIRTLSNISDKSFCENKFAHFYGIHCLMGRTVQVQWISPISTGASFWICLQLSCFHKGIEGLSHNILSQSRELGRLGHSGTLFHVINKQYSI